MNFFKTLIFLLLLCFTVYVNGQVQCEYTRPVAPIFTGSITDLDAEINAIYTMMMAISLNTNPTTNQLNTAIASYNSLNIVVNSTTNTITGNTLSSYSDIAFIRVFANYLKFNPTVSDFNTIALYARNTVWHTTLQNLPYDSPTGYAFRDYGTSTVFLREMLANTSVAFSSTIINSFKSQLAFNAYSDYDVFWVPNGSYNNAYQENCTAINSDVIHNYGNILLALVKWQDTPSEKYQYMLAYQRWLNRFLSYSTGSNDTFKPDGSAFHHWSAYEGYMYAYGSLINCLVALSAGNSQFQISVDAYKLFRDAVFYTTMISNDQDNLSISLAGRHRPVRRTTQLSQSSLRAIAEIGGKILNGTTSPDPLLAGIFKRKYGNYTPFNAIPSSLFEEGFFSLNYSMAGVFRKNNIVITTRGLTNYMWGSETYTSENRYGRYQSYGVLDIVYPGQLGDLNGYDATGEGQGWDWRYNPGATTKVLPYNKLVANWNRIDEHQDNRFSGSLSFINKGEQNMLGKVWGTYGVFGLDFRQKINQGFQNNTGPNTHDNTFTFKKSYFFFDDMIISLGSNINNTDVANKTVTTLYQRIVPNPSTVTVNNTDFTATGQQNYVETSPNWLIDFSGTGFYVTPQSGTLIVQRGDQSTPKDGGSSWNPTTTTTAHFVTKHAAIGYLDHGTAPVNKEYEYAVVPGLNQLYTNPNDAKQHMINLSNSFNNAATRPYTVIQKNTNAHIIRHTASGIFGYSFFTANATLSNIGNVTANDFPCLLMYRPNLDNTQMKFTITNPDVGIVAPRSFEKVQEKIIKIKFSGQWSLDVPHPSITIDSQDSNSTTFAFTTLDGLPIEANFSKIIVVDNTENPNNGFLPSRVTTTQRNNFINPSMGLLIFNTTTNTLQVNIGSGVVPSWRDILTGTTIGTAQTITGGSSTSCFLPSRISIADRNTLNKPATGLIIYNTTTNTIQVNLGKGATPIWNNVLVNSNVTNGTLALTTENANNGFPLPRLTTSQRDALANPSTGSVFFNTSTRTIQVNLGTTTTPAWSNFNLSVN